MAQPQAPKRPADLGPKGQGPMNPQAALQMVTSMAEQNSRMQQEAVQRVMQIQQASAQAQQQSQQQMQSGVADIANQVAGGMQRMQAEKNQREMMIEGQKQQEDLMVFQQNLARESAQEGQRIGLAMAQAREASMNELKAWQAKGQQMSANLAGLHGAFSEMVAAGKFSDQPGGYQKMADIRKALRAAEAYAEDHTDPSYMLSVVNQMHQAERDVAEGRDPMDLAAMYDNPQSAIYKDFDQPRSRVDALEGEERFRMWLRDGYPEEGLFNVPMDDPRMEHIQITKPAVLAQILIDNADQTSFMREEQRKKLVEHRIRGLSEAHSRFVGYDNVYKQLNQMNLARAPEALRMGMEAFMLSSDPKRFDRPGESIFSEGIKAMFPEHGDKMVELIRGIRDGTEEIDTPGEFALVAQLESAAHAIEARMADAIQHGSTAMGEGGETGISAMAREYATMLGPERVKQMWGADAVDKKGNLTGVGLVNGQRAIQRGLDSALAYAVEVRHAAAEQGALKHFREEFGTNSRLIDLYNYYMVQQRGDDREKARTMLYQEAQAEVDTMSLEDLDRQSMNPPENVRQGRNILDSTLDFIQRVRPTELPRVAAILSGGQVDLTDGSIQKFNSATATEADMSEYVALTMEKIKDQRQLAETVRQRKAAGAPMQPEEVLQLKQELAEDRKKRVEAIKAEYGAVGGLAVRAGEAIPSLPGKAVQSVIRGADATTDAAYNFMSWAGGQKYRDLIDKLAQPMAEMQQRQSQPQQPQSQGLPQSGGVQRRTQGPPGGP